MPFVCNAVGLLIVLKLCPVFTFLQQLMEKTIVSYLHIHLFSNVLHRLFADSRIALLCHALRICVAHAPTESCPFSLLVHALHMRQHNLVPFPCLYIELVIEVIFHYCTTPPATKLICSNVHSKAAALSASMMLLRCSLASSSFALRKSLFLSDDHLNSRMYSVL